MEEEEDDKRNVGEERDDKVQSQLKRELARNERKKNYKRYQSSNIDCFVDSTL